MKIRQLEYFCAVAEEKSISAAARKLHVAQPPISRQIALLEDELGAQLFRRGNKGMLLTFTGDATQKKFTEVTILSDGGTYRGKADAKTITLVVHAQKDEPRSVTVDGKNARFTYDKKTQTVNVSFFWRMEGPAVVRLNK